MIEELVPMLDGLRVTQEVINNGFIKVTCIVTIAIINNINMISNSNTTHNDTNEVLVIILLLSFLLLWLASLLLSL